MYKIRKDFINLCLTIKRKLRKKYRRLLRKKINKKNRKRLINNNFTLFTSNCIGGCIYNDLGLRLDSPTINLFFLSKDFVKFLENLDYYINKCKLIEVYSDKYNCPVGALDDVKIFFLHYNSFDQAKEKWEKRCKRIHWDNMFFIMADRDGCTEVEKKRFNKLDNKNKVILTFDKSSSNDINKSEFALENCIEIDNGKKVVGQITGYISKFSGVRYYDKFDFVEFLNKGKIRKNNK